MTSAVRFGMLFEAKGCRTGRGGSHQELRGGRQASLGDFWSGREAGVVVISNLETPFVRIDVDLIAPIYGCRSVVVERNIKTVLEALFQIRRCRAAVGWFASWHTFPMTLFAWLLRKPFLLIIGGYDLANLPEIGYGHQRGGLRKWIARATMGLATRLVTNSEYSRTEAKCNAGLDSEKIGMIYHGVPDWVGYLPAKSGGPVVISVGNVDRANLKRKGHEPFIRAAALLPEVEFRLIGGWRDDAIEYLKSIATGNVRFPGRVSDEELHANLIEADVYVQASAHEGFGMSLAESMLAGCVPVVSRRGAIPEVVGDCGLYLEEISPKALAESIQHGLALAPDWSSKARDRILRLFPLDARCEGLRRELDCVMVGPNRIL